MELEGVIFALDSVRRNTATDRQQRPVRLFPRTILLEQIRTIDKSRLDGYIGHLSKEHIAGMDHALAVSIDLIDRVPNTLVMCLCRTCAESFRSAGNNYLRRIDPYQVERDTCTYCNRRLGYDYELIPKAQSEI